MGQNSKIAWCDHTFNPWIGCQHVSPGCDNCYAETLMDKRYGRVRWGPHGERQRTSPANWRKPLQWDRTAQQDGKRAKVFCASLADWLDNKVPSSWRADLLELIDCTPNLDWLLLTKRIENYETLVGHHWPKGPPFNVWLGGTAEDQAHYERCWRVLSQIRARVRFISHEPSLGDITALRVSYGGKSAKLPDWIICGGESGSNARYMPPGRARALRNECERLGIAFFMKQMTQLKEIPADLLVQQFPD